MTNRNENAFPRALPTGYLRADDPDGLFWENQKQGMTKREWFVGMVLQGLCAAGKSTIINGVSLSIERAAIIIVDSLIIELNKNA